MNEIIRVLVVDDEPNIGASVEKILSRKGYQVLKVYSGKEALEKISQNQFSLALVDLMMPEMGGIELLKEIKARQPELKVVMMTGYASITTAVEAVRLGATDYVPKPFTPEELEEVVYKALSYSATEPVVEPANIEQLLKEPAPAIEEVIFSAIYCAKGKRDCRLFEVQGVCERDCPILLRKQKSARQAKASEYPVKILPVNQPIDVDMPFSEQEVLQATSSQYTQALSRSDMPILGRIFEHPVFRRKLIVVDDEEVVRRSVQKILATKGWVTDQAFDAIEALRKMEAEPYDLAIVDIRMPKMTGIQLLQVMREKYPEIVTVIITGYPSIETAVQATKLGVLEYLQKPFTPDELIAVITRGLETRVALLPTK